MLNEICNYSHKDLSILVANIIFIKLLNQKDFKL